jgi:dipeptidyl aminopeptidase/acylaminoacyl peptidase
MAIALLFTNSLLKENSMRKIFVAPLVLSSALLSAQTVKLTIDDILDAPAGGARGRGGNASVSPDGSHTVAQENGALVLKARGGADKILVSSPEIKSDIHWSPDGKRIAYVSQGQIWVVAVNSSVPSQLTHDAKGPGDPRGATDGHLQWNPNGRWILFESGKNGYNELYVVSEDGGDPHRIATTEIYKGKDVIATNVAQDRGDAVSSDRFDAHEAWSPDGTRISYTERSREHFSGVLKILPFDTKSGTPGGTAIDLYTAKNDPGGAWAVNTATWSPDSSTLAVVLQETHWDKIWLIPSRGGKPKELTFGPSEDEEPIYSPDGKWVAFESNRETPEQRHIWVVPANGGEAHRLTRFDGIEGEPRWSADSLSVHLSLRTTLGASSTYLASVLGDAAPQLIGQVRHSKFEQVGIVPEVVHWKGKDGLPLAGILYKPVNYTQGTHYPAVILAHGGPEGQVTLSAAPWSIFLADQGYVVLEPNFRGSTGYGERFRNANVEDSGGGEIDDVVAGVNYLVSTGLADPKRVGISGGSHGGTVVANAVAKYPEVFAAGIEKFGVVDRALFLKYTNRNSAIRWETKMGGSPEKKPAVYRKANILPDVAQIKTPVLVLHGEADPQVPPQESQQFVAALKAAGKIYEYHTYPNEGHGFQQRDHREDADKRELTFLDRYLKNEK